MLKQISEQEKEMIYSLIERYANIANSERQMCLEYVLRFWKQDKANLFKMFGERLILEKEVEYTSSTRELRKKLFDSKIYNTVFSQAFDHFAYYPRRSFSEFRILTHLTATHSLISNVWSGKDVEVCGIKLKQGMKISRILKKIADKFELPGFEEFRIIQSQVLNQKAQKGTLCLSIHPLDYITMSDNKCGWSSCMSWIEGGYRQGTVEMMNSPFVVVGYLKSKNEMEIGSSLWNSKKWRELFIVSPDIICGIKGYPYCDETLEAECLSWLRSLASEDQNSYTPTLCEIKQGTYQVNEQKTIDCYFDTKAMYNDTDTVENLRGYFSNKFLNSQNTLNINYSGFSECVCCGDQVDFMGTEQHLTCDLCRTLEDNSKPTLIEEFWGRLDAEGLKKEFSKWSMTV